MLNDTPWTMLVNLWSMDLTLLAYLVILRYQIVQSLLIYEATCFLFCHRTWSLEAESLLYLNLKLKNWAHLSYIYKFTTDSEFYPDMRV